MAKKKRNNTPEAETMPKQPLWTVLAVNIGLILVMVATVIPLKTFSTDISRYIYAAGALGVLVGRLFQPYHGKIMRVKRLHHIEVWTGLIFCVGAFFQFYMGAYRVGPRDWLAFTMAGAVLQVFTSIMIPYAFKKGK